MANGIIRKLDELGRITLPMEMRKAIGLEVIMNLDLDFKNGVICLTKGNGRHIDELGRYVIPKEIRRSNGWETGQGLEVYVENGAICIRKPGCEWCPETENLIEVNRHFLCWSCANKVAERVAKGV
jgi:transcriptional pleiotropic regulator of transition state genes